MKTNEKIPLNWYDHKGFDASNPNWYKHSVWLDFNVSVFGNTPAIPKHIDDQVIEILEWLFKNVDNPKRHCRWIVDLPILHVKFRHERDYLWFKLAF